MRQTARVNRGVPPEREYDNVCCLVVQKARKPLPIAMYKTEWSSANPLALRYQAWRVFEQEEIIGPSSQAKDMEDLGDSGNPEEYPVYVVF